MSAPDSQTTKDRAELADVFEKNRVTIVSTLMTWQLSEEAKAIIISALRSERDAPGTAGKEGGIGSTHPCVVGEFDMNSAKSTIAFNKSGTDGFAPDWRARAVAHANIIVRLGSGERPSRSEQGGNNG